MLWGLRGFTFLGHVVIGITVVFAVVALFAREWKSGLKRIVVAIVAFLLTVVGMGIVGATYASSVIDGTRLRPGEKARFMGETHAAQASLGGAGLVIGFVIGGLLEWRRRR